MPRIKRSINDQQNDGDEDSRQTLILEQQYVDMIAFTGMIRFLFCLATFSAFAFAQ